MRYFSPVIVAVLLCDPSFVLGDENRVSARSSKPLGEEEASKIGLEAYVYGFPVVEMYRLRYNSAFNPATTVRIPINQFRHRRELIDHNYSAVVSPNSDTLYTSAWLDLTNEPLLLHVPDSKGRYYVFQFIDFFTNNVALVGTRTTGPKGGDFLVAGRGWKGSMPQGARQIDCPTNSVLMIGRMLVDGKDDLPAVHAFQDGCSLNPLSRVGKVQQQTILRPQAEPPPYDPAKPLAFFEFLDIALRESPPPSRDAALMVQLARIGIGAKRPFAEAALDPTVATGLAHSLKAGKELIAKPSKESEKLVNGWSLPPKEVGAFGDNYLLRAEVAFKWIFALPPEEAMYYVGVQDSEGMPFSGKNKYVLRMEKGQEPPVDAFWSLTMYRLPQRLLVPNPDRRYAIGDRTKGLKRQADGSIEIYIQHNPPGEDEHANWLPAPAGDFNLILRGYLPREEMRDGKWKPPVVKTGR
jgi:hypothetical protein